MCSAVGLTFAVTCSVGGWLLFSYYDYLSRLELQFLKKGTNCVQVIQLLQDSEAEEDPLSLFYLGARQEHPITTEVMQNGTSVTTHIHQGTHSSVRCYAGASDL